MSLPWELPNLRRAFAQLCTQGDHAAAVEMADDIARFLMVFGLGRELAAVRAAQQHATEALAATSDGTLSQAVYLHESGQGEDEYNRGDVRSAYARFTALLARIEQAAPGAARGPGSYEHCFTLGKLARCLRAGGQPSTAEQVLRRALEVVHSLFVAQPETKQFIAQQGYLFADLGDVLRDQGKYGEARQAYEKFEQIARQQNNPRSQGVSLGQLGTLALLQRDYTEATKRHREALDLFQTMREPAMEAVAWHQLGMVAEEQKQWAEAAGSYRESLALQERRGDQAGVATTCNQLAIVAAGAGRPSEAEGWYKRALDFSGLPKPHEASMCNNLAGLLANEIRAGRMGRERLAEARGYAERALAIKETLDASSRIWTTLRVLADLADLEGQAAQAAAYRRRERVAFAAFPGNRWHIDKQFGPLIQAIAAAARGDGAMRAAVEAALPQLEANGWHITEATRRLWAGEREWHGLCEGVGVNSALLLLRVVEE
ncbi:MAG: tetratricopeptide repeat protein, partial [Chloroflexales bacterium]